MRTKLSRGGWAVFGLATVLGVIYVNLAGTLAALYFMAALWLILVLVLGSRWGRS